MADKRMKRQTETIREKAELLNALAEVYEFVEERLNRWYMQEVTDAETGEVVTYKMPDDDSPYTLARIKAYQATLEAIKDIAEL